MGNATVSQALGEQRDCVERLSGKTGGVRSCPKSFSRTEPSMGTASTDHSQVAACSGPNSLAHSAQRFESVSPTSHAISGSERWTYKAVRQSGT